MMMNEEEIRKFIKKVPFKLFTKDNFNYQVNKINKISFNSIDFLDKFNLRVILNLSDISRISELKDNSLSKTANGGGYL